MRDRSDIRQPKADAVSRVLETPSPVSPRSLRDSDVQLVADAGQAGFVAREQKIITYEETVTGAGTTNGVILPVGNEMTALITHLDINITSFGAEGILGEVLLRVHNEKVNSNKTFQAADEGRMILGRYTIGPDDRKHFVSDIGGAFPDVFSELGVGLLPVRIHEDQEIEIFQRSLFDFGPLKVELKALVEMVPRGVELHT